MASFFFFFFFNQIFIVQQSCLLKIIFRIFDFSKRKKTERCNRVSSCRRRLGRVTLIVARAQVFGHRGPSDRLLSPGTDHRVRVLGFKRLLVRGVPVGQRAAGGQRRRRTVTGVRDNGRERGGPSVRHRIRFPEVHERRAPAADGTERAARRNSDGGRATFVVAFVSAVEPDGVPAMGSGERLSDGRVPPASAPAFRNRPPSGVRRTPQVHAKPSSARHIVLQLYTGGCGGVDENHVRPPDGGRL